MKVVKTSEQPWTEGLTKGKYAQRRKQLGGEAMPSSLWELPPGKKSFPLHLHHVTEEALFVISGKGVVRTPEAETPVGPGDYVSFPPGGVAHQLVNNGQEPLVYLGMAAVKGVDIVEYPESNKVSSVVGVAPAAKRFIFNKGAQVAYFDGEKDAE